ncbi:MAG: hypothetical protein F4X21_06425 [Acidimicrobiia bacterium]|nr:hypothetical protein [Acidimicrobiia bacterium]MYH55815.1 hypothetical protein [Acidimicrobiia bacterium]
MTIGGGGASGLYPSMKGAQIRARRRRTRLAWLILLIGVALLGAMIATGVLRRSVLLDLISFWPGLALTVMLLLVFRRIRPGQRFLYSGLGPILPLVLLGWLALAVILHAAGWEALPSFPERLTGSPVEQAGTATVDIRLAGEVVIATGTEVLYKVSSLSSAGSVAPPTAIESGTEDRIEVTIREEDDPGWFGSSGWQVDLSRAPEWGIAISASILEADLKDLNLRSLQATADGLIRLGSPSTEVAVALQGDLVVELPTEVTVEVTGPATVGPGWEVTATGLKYQGTGAGSYLIEVAPDSEVVISQL